MLTKIKKYICPATGKPRFSYDFSFMREGRRVRLRQQGYISESEAREALELAYYGIKHGFREPPVVGTTRGRKPKERPPMTVREAYEAVLVYWASKVKESSLKTYKLKLDRYVIPYLGDRSFAGLSDDDIRGLYTRHRDVSPSSITAPLQSMINRSKEAGIQAPTISDSAWKNGKTQSREEYLTSEEVHLFLENCDPTLKYLFAVMIYTGMRIGEARGLDWSDISLTQMTIRIERQLSTNTYKISTPKSGKTRTVPINQNVLEVLKSYARSCGSDWILSGRMFPIPYEHVQREIVRCREFLGKDIVIHSLRHTAASLMIQAGISIEKIGAILGQSSASVTAQYAHLSTDSLRSAIDALPSITL